MDILCDIHNNPKYMTDFYTSTNDNIKKLLNNMHHKKKLYWIFTKKPTFLSQRYMITEKKKSVKILFLDFHLIQPVKIGCCVL